MYHTTDRSGVTDINPSDEKLKELLLAVGDDEDDDGSNPDVWLTHLETGWTVSVFPDGYVTLENNIRPVPEWEMDGLSNPRIFSLWKLLANGDIEALRSQPWRKRS
ncbi:hypothetical protein H5P28_07700 [Ruficoccus amylovorans]|uniref:Uncharacterized protein n=1 Tax=Ruficoccus amylovorans TaxID=1804625 RepID=A0A842HCD0_9BACT|nr:hypothetical protein [Ruficoccus amylovorans]MBC2594145.1 hypothetical protein [Ruficoccus amylovorans]